MKVLLIFPAQYTRLAYVPLLNRMPPLSIYYLSAILRSKGIETKIIEPFHFYQDKIFDIESISLIIKQLLGEKFDAVALSSNTANWSVTKAVIELVKEAAPEVPVIVGGVHAHYFDEYMLRNAQADIVVRGEGEEALPRVLEARSDKDALKKIDGISFLDHDGTYVRRPDAPLLSCEALSAYPDPDLHLIPKGVYDMIPVETSRGCKFSCLFCSVPHRKTWRPLSKENLIGKLSAVQRLFDDNTIIGNSVYFVDDCFSADTERAADILHTLGQSAFNLQYGLECRVTDLLYKRFGEHIPDDLIDFMQIGVELGYNEGLKTIRKGVSVEEIEKCARLLHTSRLVGKAFYSFILGFPWEDKHDIMKTVNFFGMLGLRYGIRSSVSWLALFPSDLWLQKEQYGIKFDETLFADHFWPSREELFFSMHPRISLDDVEEIEALIHGYQSQGVEIGYYSSSDKPGKIFRP